MKNYKERKKNTALVLSGGGAKGAFQVGALQVLREHGFEFDVISGVSVGCLNGAMLATGQFDKMVQVWKKIKPADILKEHSLFALARKYVVYKIGLGKPPVSKFSNVPLQKLLAKHLYGRQVQLPFHFGYVKLETGAYINSCIRRNHEHTIDKEDMKRILASTAIPVVFNPVIDNESIQVDGGLRNISPIKEVLPYNPDRVIIIPTEPLGEPPKASKVRDIIQIAFRSIEIMLNEIFREDIERFLSINLLVRQAEEQGAKLRKPGGNLYKYFEPLVIAPERSLGDPLNFKNRNVKKLIAEGRARAEEVFLKREASFL